MRGFCSNGASATRSNSIVITNEGFWVAYRLLSLPQPPASSYLSVCVIGEGERGGSVAL